MNLRDLQYIIAVAETRHFGKAAGRCFVSQPTLSGQIKKLEESLGVAIFERTNRSVEVTPIGEEILRHARLMMEQMNAIEQLAQAHQDPLAGPLRLGAIPTISPYLMPLILMPLKQQYPQLKLVLSEEMTDTLIRRLQYHEIDAALLATPVDEPELAQMPLYDEPFWLAHPRDHAFYNKETITREDLENTELLLLAEGHCLAKQAMEVCRLKERSERGEMADLRAASLETLLQLVGAGFGSTLVPALAMRGSWITGSGIVTRQLDLPDAYRRVSLVYRASYPRMEALHTLAKVILQQLPNTVTPLSS
ncbi:hydrogen peroxide-inducible genes activator [Thiohalophilus thiocyanatoxydans]|uniref:LysR family hydrogen peroxide-inducible transcriptional activator n=1 Tax=Thiohalophilus thiocyanatoxydans TaxID=381308 RepID=A0A4R8ISH0_9GAMM|nr:hydrogen peroxide-inducible genes activator [Thiohalophilus thiocyanatoxydans]TDY03991.1 LysR family hydrogen peroxide-inducible transcriptional activator [Thiohalophilus thiocyanatoxydans]